MSSSNILTDYSIEWVRDKEIISDKTYACLHKNDMKFLTKIQFQAFPPLVSKEDCFLHARTGSGKTLAFLLPTIERLRAMKFKQKHGKQILFLIFQIIVFELYSRMNIFQSHDLISNFFLLEYSLIVN